MPNTMPAGQLQPSQCASTRAKNRGRRALRDRAGDRDAADGQQLFDMELQADAEHQQDHANLRELLGELRVGDKAGRVRTDERAGQQISDDGRQPEPVRHVPERQCGREPAGEREDQIVGMHPVVSRMLRAARGDRSVGFRHL